MILDGQPVEVNEAVGIGLLNDAFDPEEFRERVGECAGRLAARAPQANRAIKYLLYRGTRLPFEKAMNKEKGAVLATSTMKDGIEALRLYVGGKRDDPAEESERLIDFYEGRAIRFTGE